MAPFGEVDEFQRRMRGEDRLPAVEPGEQFEVALGGQVRVKAWLLDETCDCVARGGVADGSRAAEERR